MSSRVMIGLEIHIQLAGKKLFCDCTTESAIETVNGKVIERRLIATTGESGKYDPAAVYEKSRSRSFNYSVTDNSCLLEADEEPPHSVNSDVLKKAISTALSLNCQVVDRVAYMRKIVIDGSNTSGFQRTAIVGFNGYVETSRGKVGISSLCLEEDSCRKLEEHNGIVSYSLDRLGVPLMEIATDPDIVDEEHAVETAEIIGKKLLLAGWARKAPDAIRQDVNFSMGHGRVEIKGVPKLSTIKATIAYEKERQTWIAELSPILKGTNWGRLKFQDVSHLFRNTKSKVIASNLKAGMNVYGTVLPGLAGYLKGEKYRMGIELADVAKLFGSGGIMHSDELPGYGVEEEIKGLVELLKPGKGDGFTIIVSTHKVIGLIQDAMIARLKKLEELDLPETRVVTEEGTTHYLRPLPGGERMYPETDVPSIAVEEALLEAARKISPKSEEELLAQLVSEFGISKQDASVILSTGQMEALQKYKFLLGDSKLATRVLLQAIPEMEKKTGRPISIPDLIPVLEEAGRRKWDRQILERAMDLYFVEHMSLGDLIRSDEMKPIGGNELKSMIILLHNEAPVNPKNIIPRIRSRTSRPFSPAEALALVKEILG